MGPGALGAVGEPIAARHAYVVQGTYRVTQDGGVASGGGGTGNGSHTFTLVVDPVAQIAIVGAYTIPLQRIDDRSFHTTGSFGVGNGTCTSVTYDEMTFTPGISGISGSGKGRELTAFSDLGSVIPVEMSFTGGLDTVAPYVPFVGSSSVNALLGYDEFSLSEPVLPGATATLVPSAGASIALTPVLSTDGQALLGFRSPNVVLLYGERYSLITDGIVDFGGNPVRSASVGTFTTRAAPPLIAEDGFESVAADPLQESQVVGARMADHRGVPELLLARLPVTGDALAAVHADSAGARRPDRALFVSRGDVSRDQFRRGAVAGRGHGGRPAWGNDDPGGEPTVCSVSTAEQCAHDLSR